MINVDKVIIFQISGTPIVLFDFSNEQLIVEESLLSGFLTAIDGFSTQLFQAQSKQMSIDSGNGIISLFKNEAVILTVISDQNLTELAPQFHRIIDEFTESHDTESSILRTPEEFWETRQKLIRVLYRIPISEDWFVVLEPSAPKTEEYLDRYPSIFTNLTKQEVKAIQPSTMQRKEFYTILNAAAYDQVIRFENMVETRDYVYGTPKIDEILKPESEAYQEIQNSFQDINIGPIVRELDCAIRVKEILDKHEQATIAFINYLYENEYITLVEENNRRIYISIDLALGIIDILKDLTKEKKVKEAIQNALEVINDPGITHKIEFQGDETHIIRDSCYAAFLSNGEIEELMGKWVELSKILIETFFPKYKKKLVEKIYEFFTQEYLNYAHTYDLGVLDSILVLLEEYMK